MRLNPIPFNQLEPLPLLIEQTLIRRIRVRIRIALLQHSEPSVLDQGESHGTDLQLVDALVEVLLAVDPWQEGGYVTHLGELYRAVGELDVAAGDESASLHVVFYLSHLFYCLGLLDLLVGFVLLDDCVNLVA